MLVVCALNWNRGAHLLEEGRGIFGLDHFAGLRGKRRGKEKAIDENWCPIFRKTKAPFSSLLGFFGVPFGLGS